MIVPASVLGRDGKVAPSNRIVLEESASAHEAARCWTASKQDDRQFVAIADPQKERRGDQALTDRRYENKDCTTHEDMAEILERDDIDAVVIATGDRWTPRLPSTQLVRARTPIVRNPAR